MEPRARVFVLLLSLLVVLVVLRQVRRWRLGLELSLLWLALALAGFFLALFQRLADRVSYWIGIHYPPALFFLLALVGGFLILLRMASQQARLETMNRRLAQEVALLRAAVESRGDPIRSASLEGGQRREVRESPDGERGPSARELGEGKDADEG